MATAGHAPMRCSSLYGRLVVRMGWAVWCVDPPSCEIHLSMRASAKKARCLSSRCDVCVSSVAAALGAHVSNTRVVPADASAGSSMHLLVLRSSWTPNDGQAPGDHMPPHDRETGCASTQSEFMPTMLMFMSHLIGQLDCNLFLINNCSLLGYTIQQSSPIAPLPPFYIH